MTNCRPGPLFSLFLFTLVDVLGFSLVLPLMPYLIKQFSMTPTQIGFLQSSNAVAQLFAVPVIGALSDKYGRRPLLILCVFATLVSFLILANAPSPFWVFFSRILDGLIGGNISLAHAYVTDITTPETRSKGMGAIGAAFGLGFVVGPAVGGFLVSYHYQAPSYAAAGLTFLNLLSVYFFLEESLPPAKRIPQVSGYLDGIKGLWHCVTQVNFATILSFRFLYLVIFTLFEYSFGFFNQIGLNNPPRVAGMLLCWFGVMYSVMQGGGLRLLQKQFAEDTMISGSYIVLGVFYLCYSFIQTTFMQFLTLIPVGLASGLLNTLINSRVSKETDQHHVGGALGISAALGSLTRIMTPPLAGLLIEKLHPGIPFVLCAILSLFSLFLWQSHLKSVPSH